MELRLLWLSSGVPAGPFGGPGWYEHDPQTVARHVLINCANLDPAVKAETRHRKLRYMINGLDVRVMAQPWVCVWCGDHYLGVKHRYG